MNHKNVPISEYQKQRISEGMRRTNKPLGRPKQGVIQLTLDNQPIKTYPSLAEAANETNIEIANICRCAKGQRKTAGGFKWIINQQ